MRKKLLFLALLFSSMVYGQTIRQAGSFTYTQLTAYSHQSIDAFTFSGNTGALAATQKISAGVFSERRFGLKDLSSHAAAFVVPTTSGNFGLLAYYMGSASYNESSVGIAYSRSLGKNVSLGVQFNYNALTASGYDAASAVNVDAGVLIRLTPQLKAGVQACNPVGTTWTKGGMGRMPALFRAGLGYDASTQFFVSAEAEKTEDKPLSINAGMQYVLAEKIVVRTGIRSSTSSFYLGFGIRMKNIRVDVTASQHPYLGLTPGLLLLYAPAK